jgi:hypothetical protein
MRVSASFRNLQAPSETRNSSLKLLKLRSPDLSVPTAGRMTAQSLPLNRSRGAQAARQNAPRVFQHALGCAKPQPCASRPAELGPALRRTAPLTCSSLPQSMADQAVRTRDVSATSPAEPRQPARIGPAQAPIGALPRSANDAHTGRSRGVPAPLAAMLRRLT